MIRKKEEGRKGIETLLLLEVSFVAPAPDLDVHASCNLQMDYTTSFHI